MKHASQGPRVHQYHTESLDHKPKDKDTIYELTDAGRGPCGCAGTPRADTGGLGHSPWATRRGLIRLYTHILHGPNYPRGDPGVNMLYVYVSKKSVICDCILYAIKQKRPHGSLHESLSHDSLKSSLAFRKPATAVASRRPGRADGLMVGLDGHASLSAGRAPWRDGQAFLPLRQRPEGVFCARRE